MDSIDQEELKVFLDEKAGQYNSAAFIEQDPIQVPHLFHLEADIEISAFLTASIAWGQRPTIIKNAKRLVTGMPGGPYEYLMDANDAELTRYRSFVHRTFNGTDCIYFLKALQNLYRNHGGLRKIFEEGYTRYGDLAGALIRFREIFFQHEAPGRTVKHVADVGNNASGKRLNMFLRWMVRRDNRGVDFGLWQEIPMHALYIPLDVHTGSVARKLGLLGRQQNDWKAVSELTSRLRQLDAEDPVRYDYALFGLGAFEGF